MSGQPIQAVVVWLGGVLVPGLQVVMSAVVQSETGAKIHWPSVRDAGRRTERWLLGELADGEYLQEIARDGQVELQPARGVAAAERLLAVDGDVLALLDELPGQYQRWLLVDYPLEWLRHSGALDALAAYFPPERQLLLRGSRLPKLMPDALHWAADYARSPLRECLFVDGDHKRAVASVRAGASVCTYVSSWRLRREFVLRRMLPVEMPSHVPGSRA